MSDRNDQRGRCAIQPAGPADVGAITDLWNHVIRDTAATFESQPREYGQVAGLLRDRRASGHGFFVAVDANGFAGFAAYGPFRNGTGYLHTMEHTVHVVPHAQGRGIGRALMEALLRHAAGRGVHAMIAAISGENPNGLAFHAALGFRAAGVLPQVGRKFERWLDLHIMIKSLSDLPDSGAGRK